MAGKAGATHDWRSDRRKSWILLGLALVVLMGTLVADAHWNPEWTQAQTSPVDSPVIPATPTPIRRTVNEVVHPQDGDALAGEAEIIGTAVIVDFMRYDIHIARAGEDRWAWVYSSSEVVHDNVLLTLNTRGYPDGRYDLRVRAVDMWGQYTEAFVRNLEIRNARPPTATRQPNLTPVARATVPAATPTPDMRARLPGGTGIYAPDYGAVLRGSVVITGAVEDVFANPVTRWDVTIAALNTENWVTVGSGSQKGMELTLATLDTTQYEDGLYDLRLRVTYQDGSFTDYFLRQLSFANQSDPQFAFLPRPGILSPLAGDTLEGVASIQATVPALDLLHWELAWSAAGTDDWSLLMTGDRPVTEAEIVRLDVRQYPNGFYDLRLRVVRRAPLRESGLPGSAEETVVPRILVPESAAGIDNGGTQPGVESPLAEPAPDANAEDFTIRQDYFVRGVQVIGLPPADATPTPEQPE